MKKLVFVAIALIIAYFTWVTISKLKSVPGQVAPTPNPVEAAKTPLNPLATNQLSQIITTNPFVRPEYIDKEQWDQLMLMRQFALGKNQPIEFYARVVDQNEMPVEGATLRVTLSRIDENIFATTNFFSWNSDEIVKDEHFDLLSDTDGWIKLSGKMTGESVRIENLSKNDYKWTMPKIGSFSYEPENKHRVGYAEMENAFDSTKGYILHLEKK